MSANEGAMAVGKFFKDATAMPDPKNEGAFVNKWRRELLGITDHLALNPTLLLPDVARETKQAIEAYVIHPDHGAQHSYFVYEGMKWLTSQEGWDMDDSLLQAAAVLHDITQLLPNRDPQSGEPLPRDQRRDHPETIARAVLQFGRALDVEERDVREIMSATLHHDDTYNSGKYARMRALGRSLADADKLFGGGLSRDPMELARDAIIRNQQGAENPQGWYLLRDDLTPEQRNEWRYGDRWVGDRVSAVRKDIFKTEFYTESGRQIADQRRSSFIEQARVSYGAEFDRTQMGIENWKKAVKSETPLTISVVGKNLTAKDPLNEPIDNPEDMETIIQTAYDRALPVNTRTGFPPARGWKIQVVIGDEKPFYIDPSIARFDTKEEFLEQLIQAFTA